jgi:preprotein translocase subunit SecG
VIAPNGLFGMGVFALVLAVLIIVIVLLDRHDRDE